MPYVPGANGVPTGGDANFPGSGNVADDNSLAGVSAALGLVPVAVSTRAVRPGAHPQDFNASVGGARPVSDRPGFDLTDATPFVIKPINDAILDFDKLSRAQKATVQNSLYQAGLYPSNYYGANPPPIVPGEIDPAARTAYRNAVEEAARRSKYDNKTNALIEPVTVDQVIRERISNRQAQGITAAAKQQQVALTSPDEIRAAVVSAAKSEYGRKADEGLVNAIIDHYQRLQTQAQTSTAPTVTNPPSVSTYATARLQAADPGAVAANRGLSVGNLFMQAFQSSAGQQPTPVSG
jgi:hypothetical protein